MLRIERLMASRARRQWGKVSPRSGESRLMRLVRSAGNRRCFRQNRRNDGHHKYLTVYEFEHAQISNPLPRCADRLNEMSVGASDDEAPRCRTRALLDYCLSG